MNALVPIGDRLDPLIRRLASNQPGEVLACVVAMKRQLAKVGLDFNDLAGMLTAPAVIRHPEPDAHCGGVSSYREAVDWLITLKPGALSGKERDFILNMSDRLRSGSPTEKQAKWIGDIFEKLGGRRP